MTITVEQKVVSLKLEIFLFFNPKKINICLFYLINDIYNFHLFFVKSILEISIFQFMSILK
jgi:hypothetical protein